MSDNISTANHRPGRRALLSTLLRVAVSGGLMWLLLRNVDMASVSARIASLPISALMMVIAIMIVLLLVQAARWRLILGWLGGTLPTVKVCRFNLEGFFFNQALPSSIGGDAIRMMRASKAVGSTRVGVESVFLDRFFGVFGLISLVGIGQIWLHDVVTDAVLNYVLIGVVVAGFSGILFFISLSYLPESLQHMRIFAELAGISTKARALVFSRLSIAVLAMSIAGHALAAGAFYVLAQGLDLNLSFFHCLLFIPTALLVTLVPISIAGWGLRENAVVGLLAYVAVPADGALSISVLFGLISILVSLPGGISWAMRTNHNS